MTNGSWILIDMQVDFDTTDQHSIVVQSARYIGPFATREEAETWGHDQPYLVVSLVDPAEVSLSDA